MANCRRLNSVRLSSGFFPERSCFSSHQISVTNANNHQIRQKTRSRCELSQSSFLPLVQHKLQPSRTSSPPVRKAGHIQLDCRPACLPSLLSPTHGGSSTMRDVRNSERQNRVARSGKISSGQLKFVRDVTAQRGGPIAGAAHHREAITSRTPVRAWPGGNVSARIACSLGARPPPANPLQHTAEHKQRPESAPARTARLKSRNSANADHVELPCAR